mgnify:CR=1 FL=1
MLKLDDEILQKGISRLKEIGVASIKELDVENSFAGSCYKIVAITYNGRREVVLDELDYKEVDAYCNELSYFLI